MENEYVDTQAIFQPSQRVGNVSPLQFQITWSIRIERCKCNVLLKR